MGCGCRKNVIKRSVRSPLSSKFPSMPFSSYKARKKKCFSCKYAKASKCKQINKLIALILRDPYFKCPLGRFNRVI